MKMRNSLTTIRTYLKRKKALELWKEGKRIKWLNEGRNLKDIERELKAHKIYFWRMIWKALKS